MQYLQSHHGLHRILLCVSICIIHQATYSLLNMLGDQRLTVSHIDELQVATCLGSLLSYLCAF